MMILVILIFFLVIAHKSVSLPSSVNSQFRTFDFEDTFLRKLAYQSKSILSSSNCSLESLGLFGVFPLFKLSSSTFISDFSRPNAISKIGLGMIFGFSSGFFIKKLAKVVTFVLGGAAISIQALSHFGYIHVNYDKIKSDFNSILDINHDGNTTPEDIVSLYSKVNN